MFDTRTTLVETFSRDTQLRDPVLEDTRNEEGRAEGLRFVCAFPPARFPRKLKLTEVVDCSRNRCSPSQQQHFTWRRLVHSSPEVVRFRPLSNDPARCPLSFWIFSRFLLIGILYFLDFIHADRVSAPLFCHRHVIALLFLDLFTSSFLWLPFIFILR